MIEWHKRLLKQMMEQFNLDSYQVAWISFIEGGGSYNYFL